MKYKTRMFEVDDGIKPTPLFVTNNCFYSFTYSDPAQYPGGVKIVASERKDYGPDSVYAWENRGWQRKNSSPLQEALVIYKSRYKFRKTEG